MHKESADLVLFTYARGLSITLESNKQQETYADMTNPSVKITKQGICHTHRHLLLTLILTLNLKVAKFRASNKASINAINMYKNPPRFKETYPSSVDFRCKITKIF